MKDYVGQWFEIYRRYSEPADIIFEIKTADQTEWIAFPHDKADGAGALFSIAEKKTWKIHSETPTNAIPRTSSWTYLKNIVLFLMWTKPRRENIWPFTVNKATHVETKKSAFHFSAAEVNKLKQIAKANQVSWNSLLFFCLHQSIAEIFDFDDKPKSWWIPVNMRRELGLDPNDDTLKKNYVSNFTIDVKRRQSLQDIHHMIAKYLKQKRHWGTWWWQHLGKFLPEAMIEKIALQNLKSNHYVGAFTNLGEWTCSADSELTVYVNAILSHPVGASAIIWNDRLFLGVSTYPTFQGSASQIAKLWEEKIRSTFDL